MAQRGGIVTPRGALSRCGGWRSAASERRGIVGFVSDSSHKLPVLTVTTIRGWYCCGEDRRTLGTHGERSGG